MSLTTVGGTGVRGVAPLHAEIVVPVHNEERALAFSVRRLRRYLDERFPLTTLVTIADNASTDRTWSIASDLAVELPGVRAVRISEKGRGRALRTVWSASDATVVAYMDVDLSTGLDALLPLVAPLLSGHSDVAIGTRLAPGSRVRRGPKRELISRSYNLIVRSLLHNHFSDAQCGFKALRLDTARALLPMVEDNEWFFDTELLVLAERNGLRIHEVPVDWVDDPDSRVNLVHTAVGDLRGIARLLRRFGSGEGRTLTGTGRDGADEAELARFAGVGVVSTAVYIGAFFALQPVLGTYPANAAVLAVCTVVNAAAHARFSFRRRGPLRRRDEVVGGAAVLVTSLALTSLGLWLAGLAMPGSAPAQLVAVTVGTAAAALVRFVVLRAWMFTNRSPQA